MIRSMLSAALVAVSFPLFAQDPVPAPAPAPAPTPAISSPAAAMPLTQSFEALVTPRSVDSVRAEQARHEAAYPGLDSRRAYALEDSRLLNGRVGVLKKDLDAAKAKAKQAGKEKREADKATADVEVKAIERQITLMQKRAELRSLEAEAAQGDREAHEARVTSLKLEADYQARLAAAPAGTQATSVDGAATYQVLRQLEKRVLEAEKRALSKQQDALGRANRVTDKKVEILEAQLQLITGK